MKKDSIKWAIVALAIIVLGIMVAAACTQGFTNANPYGWLDKKEKPPVEQEKNDGDDKNVETEKDNEDNSENVSFDSSDDVSL